MPGSTQSQSEPRYVSPTVVDVTTPLDNRNDPHDQPSAPDSIATAAVTDDTQNILGRRRLYNPKDYIPPHLGTTTATRSGRGSSDVQSSYVADSTLRRPPMTGVSTANTADAGSLESTIESGPAHTASRSLDECKRDFDTAHLLLQQESKRFERNMKTWKNHQNSRNADADLVEDGQGKHASAGSTEGAPIHFGSIIAEASVHLDSMEIAMTGYIDRRRADEEAEGAVWRQSKTADRMRYKLDEGRSILDEQRDWAVARFGLNVIKPLEQAAKGHDITDLGR